MELLISGRRFTVDHAQQTLIDMDGGARIPFAVMEPRGFSMLFLFDQKSKTFFNGDWSAHPTDEHIAMVRIPDREQLIKMELGDVTRQQAWELPKISITGDPFFVDAIEQELREVRDPSNRISFKSMSDKITHIALSYDTARKNVAQGTPEEIDRNPDVQHVRLPSLIEMDPHFMREVMTPFGFQARQELERRMKAFEQQWMRHTSQSRKPVQTKTRSRK